MKEIERNTTAELIVQEIIEDITKGKLKPGDHLKEQELQVKLNTTSERSFSCIAVEGHYRVYSILWSSCAQLLKKRNREFL